MRGRIGMCPPRVVLITSTTPSAFGDPSSSSMYDFPLNSSCRRILRSLYCNLLIREMDRLSLNAAFRFFLNVYAPATSQQRVPPIIHVLIKPFSVRARSAIAFCLFERAESGGRNPGGPLKRPKSSEHHGPESRIIAQRFVRVRVERSIASSTTSFPWMSISSKSRSGMEESLAVAEVGNACDDMCDKSGELPVPEPYLKSAQMANFTVKFSHTSPSFM